MPSGWPMTVVPTAAVLDYASPPEAPFKAMTRPGLLNKSRRDEARVTPRSRPASPAQDAHDLASFGYRQRLDRTLGGFSSFAAGFSYLSILTGLPQLFYLGFGAGGPGVLLDLADGPCRPVPGGALLRRSWRRGTRSRAASTSGRSRSARGVGWMAGLGLPRLLGDHARRRSPWRSRHPAADLARVPVRRRAGDPADAARNAVLLGCVLIAFSTLVNALGRPPAGADQQRRRVRRDGRGPVLVVLLAAGATAARGSSSTAQGRGDGPPLGYLGPLLAAALTPSFVMYGFDTAGSLAEETDDPRRRAPRAILVALASVGVAGAC